MAKISDLPEELVAEILFRVPLTSLKAVRSTCKKWNALSQNQIFGKEAARKQFLGFMVIDSRVCSLRFELHGIRNEGEFVDPSIKRIREFNKVKISQVFHHDGLLLCVIKDQSRLMVWNPYLGQIRWIKPRKNFHILDTYALGYEDSNTRNHKILRFWERVFWYEIYDFSSSSWRVLDVNLDSIISFNRNGVSLKGNAYFFAQKKGDDEEIILNIEQFLICFDFTAERFGPRLPLPFNSYCDDTLTLFCVRDEHLAVLYQHRKTFEMMEVWVSTKIKLNEVLWSKFLKVDTTPLNSILDKVLNGVFYATSFFIDEEKKVIVAYDIGQTAYIIGEDGYFKSVKIREALNLGKTENCGYFNQLVCSPYLPSLVQLQIKRQQRKRKQKVY